jgi:F-type H+-transporting ATPase subunit epsilon
MKLKILLPDKVLIDISAVQRIVAETPQGAFGLLPQRLDCVATLCSSILIYETATAGEHYVAVDEGILVKTGAEVLVSVRRALCGNDLSQLRAAVEHDFLTLSEQEKNLHSVMAKMESGFLRRMADFQHEY